MTLYTVHEPATSVGRSAADAEAIAFVKEGLCWPALFVPVLWLVYHGMWLILTGYVIVLVGIEAALDALGTSELAGGIIGAGIAVLFALEAASLRRWHLARKGFAQVGVVSGHDLEEAEHRFFVNWLAAPAAKDSEPAANRVQPIPRRAVVAPPAAAGVIGVFPQPGGRT